MSLTKTSTRVDEPVAISESNKDRFCMRLKLMQDTHRPFASYMYATTEALSASNFKSLGIFNWIEIFLNCNGLEALQFIILYRREMCDIFEFSYHTSYVYGEHHVFFCDQIYVSYYYLLLFIYPSFWRAYLLSHDLLETTDAK